MSGTPFQINDSVTAEALALLRAVAAEDWAGARVILVHAEPLHLVGALLGVAEHLGRELYGDELDATLRAWLRVRTAPETGA